jgi:hypothetical protein
MASCLLAACRKAAKELEDRKPSGLRKNEHWGLWVYRLRVSMEKHGLPAGIWKDHDGNKDGRPSAFVRLIKALQGCIPFEYRYLARSDKAFSAAISTACKAMPPDRDVAGA